MGTLVFAFILSFSIWIAHLLADKTGVSKRDLTTGILIKATGSIAFVLIFSNFYGDGQISGDAHQFLKDSRVINNLFYSNPLEYLKLLFGLGNVDSVLLDETLKQTNIWTTGDNGDLINDNRLCIRINSIIHFISFNSPYVHALVFSLMSFTGLILIYKSINQLIERKRLFFFSLIIFPSILFWSGGITKGSILILATGLFLFSIYIFKRKRKVGAITFLLSIALLLLNKPYAGLVILFLSTLFILAKFIAQNKVVIWIFLSLYLFSFIFLCYAPSSINLLEKISYKQKDLINIGKGGVFFVNDTSFCSFPYKNLQRFKISTDSVQVLEKTTGEYKLFGPNPFQEFEVEPSLRKYELYLVQVPSNSFIETQRIGYRFTSLITSIPMALINSIVRPFPSDPGSILKHVAFVSNIIILFLLVYAFTKRKKLNVREKYWILYFVLCALSISLIIGWTTPILGAVVRYKMIVDLFLICLIFTLWKKREKNHT